LPFDGGLLARTPLSGVRPEIARKKARKNFTTKWELPDETRVRVFERAAQ
jgi:hypothetical protein